jgi:hypothetical protein
MEMAAKLSAAGDALIRMADNAEKMKAPTHWTPLLPGEHPAVGRERGWKLARPWGEGLDYWFGVAGGVLGAGYGAR